MQLKNTLLAVADMERSVAFYRELLGLTVALDFGANKQLSGGLVLQTLETWKGFIDTDAICFAHNSAELYFETDDFDVFAEKLRQYPVKYVHPVKEHAWGQRVVRFYDPDKHIIEVGESLRMVCQRFFAGGMTPEQIAIRMDVPTEFVKDCLS